MNYATIKTNDIANGDGIRVSLFVSGCTKHCKGCFNEVAWDFSYGKPFTEETLEFILNELNKNYVSGLSILGGEPFEPCHQSTLLSAIKRVKMLFPNKKIWCYTGNTLRDDRKGFYEDRYNTSDTEELLSNIDVLVDGQFIEELKDISLQFRGSSNQRIINMREKWENTDSKKS